jgi:predicted acyltransferase
MKFNPTWQQLVLVAILLTAVIASNIVAPGAFGTVTSIVSVIVGYLSGSPLRPAAEDKAAPVLSIVKGAENEEPW